MSQDLNQVTKFVFDRNPALTRSAEQKQEDEKAQAEAAEKLRPLVTDSPAVAHYKASVAVESLAKKAQEGATQRLAESLFWQGRFLDASLCDIALEKAEEYIDYHEAMLKLNSPFCMCGPIQMPSKVNAKGTSIAARREIQRVYVAEMGREVAFTKCDACKQLFAQTL